MADPLIGKQLGDYIIQDILGRGGMARVYRGYDERLQRYAAVKVINSDFNAADQAEYTERFRREARAIARLHHPNIVGVYQFGDYEGNYYMAMVFVEGQDLRQILQQLAEKGKRMAQEDVLNIIRGIASALDYAHSRGVIHRDIKPSNIMLDADNRPILTDFGLALSTSEGTLGDTFGSAHYIAPEQAVSSAKAVPQSDLYSLGICLYEMLAGKVPFDDPSAMSVALKHLNDAPPPPSLYNPQLTPAIERVIMKILDKDPNQRYATGVLFTQALEQALQSDTTDDSSSVPLTVTPRQVPPPLPMFEKSPSSPSRPGNPSQPTPIRAPLIGETGTYVGAKATNTANGETAILPAATNGRSRLPLVIGIGVVAVLLIVGLLVLRPGTGSNVTATSVAGSGTQATDNTSVALNATDSVTVEATEAATSTATSTDTASPTASKTKTPTPDATEAATSAPITGSVGGATMDATSAATSAVTSVATTAATGVSTSAATTDNATVQATASGNVTLIYDQSQFILINHTSRNIDVSRIKFIQQAGTVQRMLDTSLWSGRNAQYQPYELPPNFCFQAYRNDQNEPTPLPECPIKQPNLRSAWARVAEPRWFWIGKDEKTTTFDVLIGDQTLKTCEIGSGKCEFTLP